MTATTSTDFTPATRSDDRRTSYVTGLAAFIVSSVGTVIGAHDLGEILVVLGVCAPVTIGVYGWLLPRRMATGAPGAALTLGIVAALLVVPAFWSGLPLVLGAAAVLLGTASRRGRVRSIAAVLLGALSSIAYVAIYVEELVTGKI